MVENDGGPIAPRMKLVSAYGQLSAAQGSTFHPEGGLSLRDYFAAKAMFALAIQGTCWRYSSKDPETAKRCYEMADAMLAAR